MVKVAAGKFKEPNIKVICGDVEETVFERQFDAVVVYNAFPHFPNPADLIKTLAGLTKVGGRLTVSHGMSRSAIDAHHHGCASHVSNGLMPEEELKKFFEPCFDVNCVISNDVMYQVSGVKRDA